jgi:hypothetical protein
MQLVKYLASRLGDLKENEINILKNKPIWPKENLEYSQSDKNESKKAKTPSKDGSKEMKIFDKKPEDINTAPIIQRFNASNLYTPLPLHREFGLPIIDWKGKWIRNTAEGISLSFDFILKSI